MKNAITELRNTILDPDSKVYLFIAINIAVFLVIGSIGIFEFLFTGKTQLADWITLNLSVPAFLPKLATHFWTLLTYMFGHRGIFDILFNMLWLYWFGRIFEHFLHSRHFVFTYLAGGLAGAALYILFYNTLPVFQSSLPVATLIGASASVMAIAVAIATLVPNYTITLLFFGAVRLKWLVIVYIALDILGISKANAGASISHLGGALLGFIVIIQLQKGRDWSRIFTKKQKLKIVKTNNAQTKQKPVATQVDQETIDRILDRISQSGYESLSKMEKEQLFKASSTNDKQKK